MFGFFKKEEKKEEKKETSLFAQHCYLYNEFYASMYQDFCFASEIPSYEGIDPSNPHQIDLLQAIKDMEYILAMRVGSVRIGDSVVLIREGASSDDYNCNYISVKIGGITILVQTWNTENDHSKLENVSVIHEKYLGHIKYLCDFIKTKAEQKSQEQRHKEEGAVERAILKYACKETKND